eukprot:Tamp_21303.p1 GENE.Tamp_21303~~Tamp_21303.p1  ORF type:complete len:234 (-),score=14.81 Tamp_21303:103-804(-)
MRTPDKHHNEMKAIMQDAVRVKQAELAQKGNVSVMFVYNGQSCCSATTAEGKTLKAVFEDMRVATKLNIPGNAMDLELRWTDPEDNLESTWTVRDGPDNLESTWTVRDGPGAEPGVALHNRVHHSVCHATQGRSRIADHFEMFRGLVVRSFRRGGPAHQHSLLSLRPGGSKAQQRELQGTGNANTTAHPPRGCHYSDPAQGSLAGRRSRGGRCVCPRGWFVPPWGSCPFCIQK